MVCDVRSCDPGEVWCEPYMQYGAHLMTFLGVCVCDGGDMMIQIILGIIWGSSDSFFL